MKTKKNKTIELLNRFIDERIKAILPGLIEEGVRMHMKALTESSHSDSSLLNALGSALETSKKPINENIEQANTAPMKPRKQMNFNTGNSAIDSILRATRGGIPQAPGATINESYRNLMGVETFTSDDMGKFPSVQKKSIAETTGHSGRSIDANSEMGKVLDAAMNRDYSELVKKFKK